MSKYHNELRKQQNQFPLNYHYGDLMNLSKSTSEKSSALRQTIHVINSLDTAEEICTSLRLLDNAHSKNLESPAIAKQISIAFLEVADRATSIDPDYMLKNLGPQLEKHTSLNCA